MPIKGKGKTCVSHELKKWKHGKLHSGKGKEGKKGPIVKSRDQAIAIALSVCGKSDHTERDLYDSFVNFGFSEESAKLAAKMLYQQPNWKNQFRTGETLSQMPREEKTVTALGLSNMDIDNRAGKQKGNQGKHERHSSHGLFPVTIPKGNPQQGPRSRSDVKGMAAF